MKTSKKSDFGSPHFIEGIIATPAGDIPRVAARLSFRDRLGAILVRWSVNRENYRVDPGLYAAGAPTITSDVFVTANYKLSFDHLRRNLDGLNAWILVLDTRGINVLSHGGHIRQIGFWLCGRHTQRHPEQHRAQLRLFRQFNCLLLNQI